MKLLNLILDKVELGATRVHMQFNGKFYFGTVTSKIQVNHPSTQFYWRVLFDDGDGMDLEDEELVAVLVLEKKKPSKKNSQAKRGGHHALYDFPHFAQFQ